MPTWIDERCAEERRKDMLHEAERHRLVAAALASRPKRASFYGPALVYVGKRFVRWGTWLLLRYNLSPG